MTILVHASEVVFLGIKSLLGQKAFYSQKNPTCFSKSSFLVAPRRSTPPHGPDGLELPPPRDRFVRRFPNTAVVGAARVGCKFGAYLRPAVRRIQPRIWGIQHAVVQIHARRVVPRK